MQERRPGLYLHLGLPKTGTTFLQKAVLPHISDVEYLWKPKGDVFRQDRSWVGILEEAFNRSPVVWDDLGEAIFTSVFGRPEEIAEKGAPVLVSEESICLLSLDPAMLREHLLKFRELAEQWGFGQFCLLATVRQQADIFASHYAQNSKWIEGASQDDFERRLRSYIDRTQNYYRENYYRRGVSRNYELLWNAMRDVVDAERILLLPYEMMKENLESFVGRWIEFLGLKTTAQDVLDRARGEGKLQKRNVRSSAQEPDTWGIRDRAFEDVTVLRLRPARVFKAVGLSPHLPLRLPDWSRDAQIQLTPALRSEVMAFYEDSNRALAAVTGINLSEYGYYS